MCCYLWSGFVLVNLLRVVNWERSRVEDLTEKELEREERTENKQLGENVAS